MGNLTRRVELWHNPDAPLPGILDYLLDVRLGVDVSAGVVSSLLAEMETITMKEDTNPGISFTLVFKCYYNKYIVEKK